MIYFWASATDTGRVRAHNEDSVWPADIGIATEGLVAAVADGMGGHVGGEIASKTALDAAIALDGPPRDRVRAANQAVMDKVRANPHLAGMGTTLTLGMFARQGQLEIGHVGDSRAYILRDGVLHQLTRDHSLVAEMVESGKLAPEDVSTHPYRSIVTRALGLDDTVQVDVVGRDLHEGDRVLLCSDGLTSMISDSEIFGILERTPEPSDATVSLVEAANRAGGADNVTVVVVDVSDDGHR
jgi:protein phosphatase